MGHNITPISNAYDGPQNASPSNTENPVQTLLDANPTIEFIRYHWLDYTGTVRCRMTSTRTALRLAKETGTISVASPSTSAFLLDGSFHEIHTGKKDHLVPDWSTLTVLQYAPGHAGVQCSIDEGGQGTGFETDPRTFLKRVETSAKADHGISFLIGVEVEFYLCVSDGHGGDKQVDDVQSYCATTSLRTSSYLSVLEDSVRNIEAAGIPVWTFHSELVAGLFEISLEPLGPVEAADAVVYVGEAVKAAAVGKGFRATMHPKPFDKTHGVGMHCHVSLNREGEGGKGEGEGGNGGKEAEKEGDDGFLAGVLESAPAICAITMPSFDSYLRADFAGGDWIHWDHENRLSTVRKIRDSYWEFRFVDATANPYLVLGTILGVGLKALKEGMMLEMKAAGGKGPKFSEEERAELGITKRAPGGLREAVEALRADEVVKGVLGEKMWERYLGYKGHEEEMLAGMTLQERRKLGMSIF